MTAANQELQRDKRLIANLEAETSEQADEIERLIEQVKNWKTWARSQLGYPYEGFVYKERDVEISDAVADLAKRSREMSEKQLAKAIQDLINITAEQTAGNIYRATIDDERHEKRD